jgi:hypothetical protein
MVKEIKLMVGKPEEKKPLGRNTYFNVSESK